MIKISFGRNGPLKGKCVLSSKTLRKVRKRRKLSGRCHVLERKRNVTSLSTVSFMLWRRSTCGTPYDKQERRLNAGLAERLIGGSRVGGATFMVP